MEYSSTEPRLSAYLHTRACRAGTPLAGNFELTARCNFDCKMCYVHLTAEEQRMMKQIDNDLLWKRRAATGCCSCCSRAVNR